RADAEHDHEDAVNIDAERIDHHRILDTGTHDHAEPGPVEHDEQGAERYGHDADDRQTIGRIKHEAERGDALEQRWRRHQPGVAGKHQANQFDEADAQPEGDKQLILVRTGIEVPDDDALHHYAHEHDEQRAGDHRDRERSGVLEGDIAGVAAEHEH